MLHLNAHFFVAAMLLLVISRLCLASWQWVRVRDAGGLMPVLFGGLRIDLSFVSMLVAFPMLLSPWIGGYHWAVVATEYWFAAWWLVLVLLEVSTPQFILEYDTRPNRLFIEYLVHPREVSSMLWHGYKKVLLVAVLLLAALVWLGMWWMGLHAQDVWLPVWQRMLLTGGLFVVLFLAARGTLGHRPLNAAQVAFSSDAMVNMLPLNSTFVVANAIRAMRRDRPASAVYGNLDEERMHTVIRREAAFDGPPVDAELPSMHAQHASATPDRPHNIVVIIEESLGAQFVGCLGGRPLTPCFDALAEEGWLLARTYATGTRSVRGLEAVLAGFLPTPAEAVVKLPRSQRDFFTLAGLLGSQGYHSRFIYGGEAHFDNMKGFFYGNGFDEVIDQPRFSSKPTFVGSWGACDEDMFNELHQRLLALLQTTP